MLASANLRGSPHQRINGKFLNMEFMPDKMWVCKSCSHPVATTILVKSVDNNGIWYNCQREERVQGCGKFFKMASTELQRQGELDWFLSVQHSYCKLTGAISYSQEAYIHRLLVNLRHGTCQLLQAAHEPRLRLGLSPHP